MPASTDHKRVIQITAIPESETHSALLFALTDDGSILSIGLDLSLNPPDWGGWAQLPPIPQTGRQKA